MLFLALTTPKFSQIRDLHIETVLLARWPIKKGFYFSDLRDLRLETIRPNQFVNLEQFATNSVRQRFVSESVHVRLKTHLVGREQ